MLVTSKRVHHTDKASGLNLIATKIIGPINILVAIRSMFHPAKMSFMKDIGTIT